MKTMTGIPRSQNLYALFRNSFKCLSCASLNTFGFPILTRFLGKTYVLLTFVHDFNLILSGKGYDRDESVRWIEQRGGIVVIPSRVTARHHLYDHQFFLLKYPGIV